MVLIVENLFPTEPSYQVPKEIDSLKFLKSSIESYENWKSNLRKQSLNIRTKNKHEVASKSTFKKCVNIVKNNNAYRNEKSCFQEGYQSKSKNLSKYTNISGKDVVQKPKLVEKIKANPDSKQNISPSLPINGDVFITKNNKSKVYITKEEGELCLDTSVTTKQKSTFKICKPGLKKKKTSPESPQVTLNLPNLRDESQSNIIPDIQKRQTNKIRPNISELLINLQQMSVEKIEEEMLKFASPQSVQSTGCEQQTTSNEFRKSSDSVKMVSEYIHSEKSIESKENEHLTETEKNSEELALKCKKEDIRHLLKESNYTKSEIDILLDELRYFPAMNEAVDRFDEMVPDSGDESKIPPLIVGHNDSYPGKQDILFEQEDAIPVQEESEDQQLEDEINEEEMYTDDDEIEDESELERAPSSVHEMAAIASQKLQGVLYNTMSQYYTSRFEGLISIKDYLNDNNEYEFHNILYDAIKEYGLPKNEEALRSFFSNIIDKISEVDRGMTHLKAADYYESMYLKKIERGEKYNKSTGLIELFVQRYLIDRDLFEVLAPYLQTIHEEVKAGKITKKGVKKRKKKKKKKIVEEVETGPFNVLLRSGIRNKVWRSALKKLKKKTDVLKKTIDHKLKSGLPYNKYHQHFAEYFKTKRKKIKRLRNSRKTSTLIKAITLDLSEAESTTSLSSGDFYPEMELMNSILQDYQEKSEFPVPYLERKKRKLGKRAKLKKEKLHERSGCDGGIKGAPNTPEVEKNWYDRDIKKSTKRRARIVEEYLYSSCEELTGLKGPPQKNEKQLALKVLADQLLKGTPHKVWSDDEIIAKKKEVPKKNDNEEIKQEFFRACSKYKMLYVYELIERYHILKPPYDSAFVTTALKIMYGIEPYDVLGSFNKAMARKLLKTAIRTIFGMFYMAQKELNILNEPEYEIDKLENKKEMKSEKLVQSALLANATIQKERHMKWLRRYFGVGRALKTERKMPLYFGPNEEAWMKIEPIDKNKAKSQNE